MYLISSYGKAFSWKNESFSNVGKEIYLVFKSSISAVKTGKKPFPFCCRVSLVIALSVTAVSFPIQIKYDLFSSPQSLIKNTSKFMIKQFMKCRKFYQGKQKMCMTF